MKNRKEKNRKMQKETVNRLRYGRWKIEKERVKKINALFDKIYDSTPKKVACKECGVMLEKENAIMLLDSVKGVSFFHKDCGDEVIYKNPQMVVARIEADNKYTILYGEKNNRTMYPNKD